MEDAVRDKGNKSRLPSTQQKKGAAGGRYEGARDRGVKIRARFKKLTHWYARQSKDRVGGK